MCIYICTYMCPCIYVHAYIDNNKYCIYRANVLLFSLLIGN